MTVAAWIIVPGSIALAGLLGGATAGWLAFAFWSFIVIANLGEA